MAETQLLRILGMGQLYDGERNPRLVVNCISVMDVIWQYMKENIFAFFNLKKKKKTALSYDSSFTYSCYKFTKLLNINIAHNYFKSYEQYVKESFLYK